MVENVGGRGISTALGAVLLVGLTLVASIGAAALFFGFSDTGPRDAPLAVVDVDRTDYSRYYQKVDITLEQESGADSVVVRTPEESICSADRELEGVGDTVTYSGCSYGDELRVVATSETNEVIVKRYTIPGPSE